MQQLKSAVAAILLATTTAAAQQVKRHRGSLRELILNRNVLICTILSIILVGYLLILFSFMPLFLVQQRGFDRQTMSWLMAMWGLSSMAYAFLVPGLSDFIGRRPVMVLGTAIGAALPLSALLCYGPMWQLFALFALGSIISGTYPLFMAAVPAESVPAELTATVMGLTMGLGEIAGGVAGPVAAGAVADRFGLQATLWTLVALTAAACLLALAVRETAPAVLARQSPLRAQPLQL